MGTNAKMEAVQLPVSPDLIVSGVLGIPQWWPSGYRIGAVLAHDVGGTMDGELVTRVHAKLVEAGYMAIRFNFPYAEQGRKRPDPPALLEKTFRAAVSALMRSPQDAPAQLVFGGFGLGSRVAAQAVAQGLKADGVICIGFPLHPSGKPSQQRADELFRIICPILFVQGERDAYCRLDRLEGVLRRVGAPSQLSVIRDADHSFEPIKRSSRTREEIHAEVCTGVSAFLDQTAGGS